MDAAGKKAEKRRRQKMQKEEEKEKERKRKAATQHPLPCIDEDAPSASGACASGASGACPPPPSWSPDMEATGFVPVGVKLVGKQHEQDKLKVELQKSADALASTGELVKRTVEPKQREPDVKKPVTEANRRMNPDFPSIKYIT